MGISKFIAAALVSVGVTTAASIPGVLKRSPEPELKDGKFLVGRQAEFDNHVTFSFESGTIPEGLQIDTNELADRYFSADNIIFNDGALELLVPGGQTAKPYSCSQIQTTFDVKYASVRTVAILTEVPGVCNGMFLYKDDNQETDIEWVSDPNSTANVNAGGRKIWFTNQDIDTDDDNLLTQLGVEPPSNPTTTEHEYRLDWTEGLTQWYLDGELIWEATTDVPYVAGPWLWNNWFNGNIGWSSGPPAEDAIFKIRSIDMYYNAA